MIVITVVGSIAFSVGASTITSFRQQTQLEDSQNAYAAATAGLEDGLVRWRFDKDTETPHARGSTGKSFEDGNKPVNYECANATRPTPKSVYYDRVDLTNGKVVYCINPDDEPAPDPTHIIYDLKIQYKLEPGQEEKVVSETTASGTVPALQKDAAVEYDVSELKKLADGKVDLGWVFQNLNTSDRTIQFEVYALKADGNVIDTSKQVFGALISSLIKDGTSTITFDLQGGTKVRIRPYGRDLLQYQLKPSAGAKVSIDSRTTEISTVGYFGSSKRKLKLDLDRSSGTILPLYDYALFSGDTGITP